MSNILNDLYPTDEIFVRNPIFGQHEPTVDITCCVPESQGYMLKPMPYISTENWVRIFSQTCYLLGDHVVAHKMTSLNISSDAFRDAATSLQLYYRTLDMKFHKVVLKGQIFQLKLSVTGFKHIQRLDDLVLFTFTSDKAQISGEMSFIFAPHAR